MSRCIVVKNFSTVVADMEIRRALPAFQKQLTRDFVPYYGGGGHLVFGTLDAEPPKDSWLLYLYDDADQAGALGYHDLGKDGQPLSKVFAKTTMEDGALWTVCFSHELLEMDADPNINLLAFDEGHGRAYCYEPCDAPEADAFGYEIDGVRVSDFVLPAWFEPTHVEKGERFAFKSPITAPFQLMPGGYIGFYDVARRRWNQINSPARTDGRPTLLSARDIRDEHPELVELGIAGHGHRRVKRAKPRLTWKKSTAL